MNSPTNVDLEMRLGERVPARDGTLLAAHLYRPRDAGPLPVVLTLTPYGADYQIKTARCIASRGYAYLIVECRGRGDSEGRFAMYEDAPDVVDAIAWAARQPWSDGRVALQGGSYAGLAQWPVAAAHPPALVGITPLVAPMPGYDSDTWGGVFPFYHVSWARLVSGRSAKWRVIEHADLFRAELAHQARSGRPASAMTQPPCPGDTTLVRMLEHPQPGSYWDFARPDDAGFAGIDVPALSLTGTADSAMRGAIRYFEEHDRLARTDSLRRLVIGPWNHAGGRMPERLAGDGAGPDPLADPVRGGELESAWFDYLFGRGPLPDLLRHKVSVFVAGEEAWRGGESLAALSDGVLEFDLTPASATCDERNPGRLQVRSGGAGSSVEPATVAAFRYDPNDQRFAALEEAGTVGNTFDAMSGEAPWESGFADHLFRQGLRFETPPLEEPVVLLGAPALTLRLRVDVLDTDLMYVLQMVLPDDRALAVSADMLRLRYRGWDGGERPMQPGVVETIRFEHSRFNARRIPAGSWLRLTIRTPASIYFERHRNRWIPVHDQVAADSVTANIEVLCGGADGSCLRVPFAVAR